MSLALHTTAISLHHTARHYLRRHTRLLRPLADSLRTIAFLTPSPHAELHAEAAASAVALLALYRDLPAAPGTPPAVPLLAALSAVQLLVEMLAARRRGPAPARRAARLNAATVIEAAKLALRLALIAAGRPDGKLLTAHAQSLPETPPPPECTCGMRAVPGAHLVAVHDGPRSGRKILRATTKTTTAVVVPAAAGAGKRRRGRGDAAVEEEEEEEEEEEDGRRDRGGARKVVRGKGVGGGGGADPMLDALFVIAYERRANWVVRMFMPEEACEACAGSRARTVAGSVEGITRAYAALKPGELAAEVAYVARPLVQLLLIRRLGWRSWRAWAAALMMDLGSRAMMAVPRHEGDVEERRRRMAQLVLYLGRSPLFDLLMQRVVRRMLSPLRRIPVVGTAASSAIEWATLLQQYWFYTSGS